MSIPRSVVIPCIVAALSATPVAAQRDFSGVEIKTTHVSGAVYMLEGSGGNIGVSVGDDGILMIDDQFAPLAEKIRAALADIKKGKVDFVLNTHWHGDHVGGNAEFGRESHIIAHSNVRRRVSRRQELFGRTVEPLPEHALPIITYDDGLTLHFNDEKILVIHLPHGHTDGDSIVYFTGSNVVHVGDDMFAGMFPFVDLDHGGDVEGLARNVKQIIDMMPEEVKVIPGHGPLSTLDDLKGFHRMLVKTTEIVKNRIDAGKSLEEIKKEGLPEEWKPWGRNFIKTDQWIETVYNSLTRHR